MPDLSIVFNETIKNVQKEKKRSSENESASRRKKAEEIFNQHKENTLRLERLTDGAATSIRNLCLENQEIRMRVLESMRVRGVHVMQCTGICTQGILLYTDTASLDAIALHIQKDAPHVKHLLEIFKTTVPLRMDLKIVEQFRILPVKRSHAQPYGIVWHEIKLPTISKKTFSTLERMQRPLDAVRILATAVA